MLHARELIGETELREGRMRRIGVADRTGIGADEGRAIHELERPFDPATRIALNVTVRGSHAVDPVTARRALRVHRQRVAPRVFDETVSAGPNVREERRVLR